MILFIAFFSRLIISKDVKKECMQDLEEYYIEKEMISSDESIMHYYRFIDEWNGFKYYCKYIREYNDLSDSIFYVRDCMIQKYKGSNLVAEFNLQNIPDNVGKDKCIVLKGLIHDNELFFTVRTNEGTALENNIYRIDLNLNYCISYANNSSYGAISPTTLQFYNNQLLYITDKANVITYDGETETLLCQLPLISEKMKKNDFVEANMFDFEGTEPLPLYRCNYQVCYNGKDIVFAAGRKLFVYKNSKIKEIYFNKNFPNVFNYNIDASPICKVELICSGENKDLIKISIDWYSNKIYGKSLRYIYAYDTQTAISKCFKGKDLYW